MSYEERLLPAQAADALACPALTCRCQCFGRRELTLLLEESRTDAAGDVAALRERLATAEAHWRGRLEAAEAVRREAEARAQEADRRLASQGQFLAREAAGCGQLPVSAGLPDAPKASPEPSPEGKPFRRQLSTATERSPTRRRPPQGAGKAQEASGAPAEAADTHLAADTRQRVTDQRRVAEADLELSKLRQQLHDREAEAGTLRADLATARRDSEADRRIAVDAALRAERLRRTVLEGAAAVQQQLDLVAEHARQRSGLEEELRRQEAETTVRKGRAARTAVFDSACAPAGCSASQRNATQPTHTPAGRARGVRRAPGAAGGARLPGAVRAASGGCCRGALYRRPLAGGRRPAGRAGVHQGERPGTRAKLHWHSVTKGSPPLSADCMASKAFAPNNPQPS